MREKKDILPILIDASSLLVSSLEISEILPRAMEIIKDLLLDCEAASIMLVDEKNEKLVFEVALGEKGDDVKKISLPLGKGIAGEVALKGEPLIIQDAYTYPAFDPSFDEKTGFRTKSIICTPIKIKNKIIGVAEAINPRGKRSFDEDDVYLLSFFCNEVALAVESARLHKKILQQKRLEDELNFARSIQESFLPHVFPECDNFSFYAVTYPARTVGGDFYDISNFGGQRLDFIIGDVSGKGVPAALFMAKILSDAKALSLKYNNTINPALVLEELNTSLWERHTGRMFVTLIYGIFIPRDRKIVLSSSAHPYPYFFEGQKQEWRDIQLDNGVPIGVAKEAKYNNNEIYLNKGDALVFLTDGLTEAADAKGDPFIPKALSKLPIDSAEASCIGQALIKELNNFIPTPDLFDDATLLIIKCK